MQFLSIKIRPNDDAQHSTSASLHKSTNISSSNSSYVNGKPTFKTAVATREKKKKPDGDAKTPKKKDDSKAGKQDEDGSDLIRQDVQNRENCISNYTYPNPSAFTEPNNSKA